MSFDIFVQDLPADAKTIDDIPDSFLPAPIGPRKRVLDAIRRAIPDVVFDDAGWANIESVTYSLEIHIDDADPTVAFALYLRRGEAALDVVAQILHELDCRALVPGTASGFFEPGEAREAYAQWRHWLASRVERDRSE